MSSIEALKTTDEPADSDTYIWSGVQALLDDYIHISDNDSVLVVYTEGAEEAAAWVSYALKSRHIESGMFKTEPLVDPRFAPCLDSHLVKAGSSGRVVLIMMEKDTVSHESIIQDLMARHPLLEHLVVRMFGASLTLLARGAIKPPEWLAARNATILEVCRRASHFRITAPGGTDLQVTLDAGRYRWVSMSGLAESGQTLILPSGEVATYPALISGRLVADFAMHANRKTPDDVRLSDTPVIVDIRNGLVTSLHCENREILAYLNNVLSEPNALHVGELGFGTHPGASPATRENSHLNERCQGVHLGIGRHITAVGDVDYECSIHVDLIAEGGHIQTEYESIDLRNVPAHQNWQFLLSEGEDIHSPPLCETQCCPVM